MDDVDGKQCTLYGMLDKLNECVGGRGSAEPVATSAELTHARHAFTYTHTHMHSGANAPAQVPRGILRFVFLPLDLMRNYKTYPVTSHLLL